MSFSPGQDVRLLSLLESLRAGSIAGPQLEALTALAAENSSAREMYLEHTLLIAALRWTYGNEMGVALPSLDETASFQSMGQSVEASRKRARRFGIPSAKFVGVAASLILVGYFVALMAMIVWDRAHPSHHPSGQSLANLDASGTTLSELRDCEWENFVPSANSAELVHRQLRLRRGLAEVKLRQGAEVVIEGPADWSIDGKNSVSLRAGKLLARVPNDAIGFTVETPTAKIVDLGTEFGVVVDPRSGSVVHVMKGEVTITARETSSGQVTKRVSANQAVQVGTNLKLQPTDFDTAPFTAILKTPRKSIGQTPNEIAGLRLWLCSDRGVELDATGHVERWADQSGNGFDAVQADPARRPRLLSANEADRGSLRFDGMDDFLACEQGLDLDNAGDSTIFLLVTPVGPFKDNSGIFCLRPRQFADRDSPDGLLIAEDFHAQERHIGIVQNVAFTDATTIKNAIVLGGKLFDSEPLVITFTKSQSTSTLRINGRTLAVDQFQFKHSDPKAFINTAGYVLGTRVDQSSGVAAYTLFCEMDLSVVLVYDRTIAGKESTAIETYLKTSHP